MNVTQALSANCRVFSFFHLFTKQLPLMVSKESAPTLLIKNHALIKVSDKPGMLHIEISSEKINTLLERRMICAADIRCLDIDSQQCLKKLCLKTCLYNLKLYNPSPQISKT